MSLAVDFHLVIKGGLHFVASKDLSIIQASWFRFMCGASHFHGETVESGRQKKNMLVSEAPLLDMSKFI